MVVARFTQLIWVGLLMIVSMSVQAKSMTHEFRLDNGLKLVVREDHRAPVVVSQIWYKVGSCDESNGQTGISHALEHMMFKGTSRFPAGQLDFLVAKNGGIHNAFTSYDQTAYYEKFSRDQLALSFELEADRLRGLILSEDEFAQEKKVVIEERLLNTDDNPHNLVREKFLSLAHQPASSYRHPVIGWMEDIEQLTVADLQQWYNHWYQPANAIVVVVGDVEPQAVYQMAQKYFGSIPTREVKRLAPRKADQVGGARMLTMKLKKAKVPELFLSFNVPSLHTVNEAWESYALEVLTAILDTGASSRFVKNLIRGQEIAAGIDVSYSPFTYHAGLLHVSAIPTSTTSLEVLEQGILAQFERLKNELVDNDELDRIKSMVIASRIYENDSISSKANEIGFLESADYSWQLGDSYVDNIKAVTREQIQKVARKYLTTERRTIAHLLPESTFLEEGV